MKEKKISARARKGKPIAQVAALPFRRCETGVEFMLLTSRETQRFVLPKGWPMRGRSDPEAAAQEAREEAGLVGRHAKKPIGRYRYWKRLSAAFVPISVAVYPLLVERQRAKWPEMRSRSRAWVSPAQAALLVDEPELVALFTDMADEDPEALAGRLEEKLG